MKILIACEFSGVVRSAFDRKGHDATSCDLLPTSIPGKHYVGDVRDILYSQHWDMMIAHPPCTYLCSSGLHWNKKIVGRSVLTQDALDFVRELLEAPIERIALENPIGCISSYIRKPDQIIQPYNFNEDASKKTCLWLKNLPKLASTIRVAGRMIQYNGKMVERWSNQTDSGQNCLGPSEDRGLQRSITYKGIAEAMANQWG